MAADLTIIVFAVVAAYFLRFKLLADLIPSKDAVVSYPNLAIPLEVAAPLMMLAMLWAGQYRPRRDQRFHLEAAAILKGTAVGLGATIVSVGLLQNILFQGQHFSGWQFAIYGVCTAVALLTWRFGFRTALRAIRARGWNLRHVAIIGTGRLGQLVYHTLRRNSWTGINPVFFISHHEMTSRKTCQDLAVKGGLANLEATLDAADITGILIAVPGRLAAALPDLLMRLERYPIDVRIVPDMNPKYMPINMSANELDGMPILSIRESPLSGWGRVTKRTLDLAEKRLNAGRIPGPLARQFASYHFASPLVHTQMELAIVPAFWRIAQLADVNRKTTAVDQDVDWCRGISPVEEHFPQFGLASRYCRVVRHIIVQVQQI